MNISLIDYSTIAWTISLISIALCPTMCALMAYRISSIYSNKYSNKPLENHPRKLTVVPMPIDEASVNEAVKNLVF
jgi:hypothetical protein